MSKKLTIAVIGAKGNMGRFLVQTLSALGSIIEVDKASSNSVWGRAWKADIIWLSVPREAIPSLLQGKKFSRNQLIIDVCTLKRGLGGIVAKSGAMHLSLHPLHGSKVPLIGQRWAVIQTRSRGDTRVRGRVTVNFLKKLGVAFLPPVSEKQHDFMMGLVLSIPEVLTVVIDRMVENYANHSGREVPTREELMRWAAPASNAIFGAYLHIVNSTPKWLRYEIVREAPHDVLAAVQGACKEIENLSLDGMREEIAHQSHSVRQIALAEQDRIRRWVNQWFVDSTKTLFKVSEESRVKPALNIQWMEGKEKIFPRGRKVLTVGIHGIDGCFTHEALLRFLEENGISERRINPKFLVTAENVLRAVTSGKTNLGIFAIANSGSGAYVSSMGPIASHTFNVRAVLGMEIMQCLLAHKSVKSVDGIKEVFGHPQAVSQCKRTLKESYPRLKVVAGEDSDDTALCAKRVAEGMLPRTTATLASQIAAKRYGLNIISYNMHHDPFNTTTFLLVSKK